ncbi:Protoporphyrinogen oxidase [Xylariaceae sp. FL0255]|nr:Protoporphyrinogen oxidase [Xylariaceae sp. FL0255]
MIPHRSRPEDVFINLLRSIYSSPRHSTIPSPPMRPLSRIKPPRRLVYDRAFATTSENGVRPREIAVLGAGMTGLTVAHYLSRFAKDSHITIYEANDRPGGWINSELVPIDVDGQKGHVLFHHGPSMLRSGKSSKKYDDLVLYDLLVNLRMYDMLRAPRYKAGNRYIYYPDHLVKLPTPKKTFDNIVSGAQSLLTEPLWSGWIKSAINWFNNSNKALDPENVNRVLRAQKFPEDESIGNFLQRMMGDDRITKNVASAVIHGIYGGDISKISAKHSVLDGIWFNKAVPLGDITTLVHKRDIYLFKDMMNGPNVLRMIELAEKAIDWDLMTFGESLMPLIDTLVEDLKKRKNVTFRYNEPVTALEHANDQILVTTPKSTQPAKYDRVISTLFSKKLAEVTQPPNSLPSLAETHAVTIMTVNLWYPSPDWIPSGDFGYLIPSSTPDNDEGCLGVLFGAEPHPESDEPRGTKLTIMLGGHHWDGWTHYPTKEMGIAMARAIVERQLGIPANEEPIVATAHLCQDCLPQHFVGHRERMAKAHYELLSTFNGRLTVAGPSYTAPGVIPSIRAGFEAAMRVARGKEQPWHDGSYLAKLQQHHGVREEYTNWWPPNPKELRDAQGGPSPDQDPVVADGGARDFVGETGLQGFTEKEWETMVAVYKGSLHFRTFTHIDNRFLTPEGDFLNHRFRQFANSPRRRQFKM